MMLILLFCSFLGHFVYLGKTPHFLVWLLSLLSLHYFWQYFAEIQHRHGITSAYYSNAINMFFAHFFLTGVFVIGFTPLSVQHTHVNATNFTKETLGWNLSPSIMLSFFVTVPSLSPSFWNVIQLYILFPVDSAANLTRVPPWKTHRSKTPPSALSTKQHW